MEENKTEVAETGDTLAKPAADIQYYRPLFHRRIFADLLDTIFMALLGVLLFVGFRTAFLNLPESSMRSDRLEQNRSDCGLYVKSDGQFSLLPDYYKNHSSLLSAEELMKAYETGMDKFIGFLDSSLDTSAKATVKDSYDTYRLDQKLDGVAYFVTVDGTITKNSASTATYEQYSTNVYAPYIRDYAEGYFNVYAPHYIDDTHYFSLLLLFAEIPLSVFSSAMIVLFLPPLFLKRGRQTLGKAIYKIGRVDSHILSPTTGRYCAESAILILGIITLSVFTLGIPLIISFSMMAFSKKKQDFPDYMLGIEEVDLTDSKIYFTLEEAAIEKQRKENAHVEFTPTSKM
jgi:hypothetical protein